MNDFTEANIWPKEVRVNKEDDIKILDDDSIPGPVKQSWIKIKDKELYMTNQLKNKNIYTTEYQTRDDKVDLKNFINYTWQDIQSYNLSNEILLLFRTKLEGLKKFL